MKTSRFTTLGYWSMVLFATSFMVVGCASGDGEEDVAGDGDGDGATPGDGDGATPGDGDSNPVGDGDGLGGAAGDGDADGPTSVCDDNSFAPESAEVSDLEDGVAGWDIYASTEADADNGAVLTAPAGTDFGLDPEIADEGADGSAQSLHFAGTGWATYGAGLNLNLEGCKDLSAYTGVRFWIKGSAAVGEGQETPPDAMDDSVNFRITTAGSHAIIINPETMLNDGGDCDASKATHRCFMPPQVDVPLTSDWVMHEIPFTDLKTPAGANPGSAFTGTNAMLLGWHSEAADFDLYIDEVEFY